MKLCRLFRMSQFQDIGKFEDIVQHMEVSVISQVCPFVSFNMGSLTCCSSVMVYKNPNYLFFSWFGIPRGLQIVAMGILDTYIPFVFYTRIDHHAYYELPPEGVEISQQRVIHNLRWPIFAPSPSSWQLTYYVLFTLKLISNTTTNANVYS